MPRRFRVLLVDDDPVILDLFSFALSHKHYDVTAASNGKSALEALGSHHFDLVITDLHMEPVDGFAVLKRAKELNPKTSVYVMTGDGDANLAFRSLRGADDFLPKPFDLMEFLQRVDHVYNQLEPLR